MREREDASTHLELVLEEVLLGGHFAVHAKEPLLLRAQGLDG